MFFLTFSESGAHGGNTTDDRQEHNAAYTTATQQ